MGTRDNNGVKSKVYSDYGRGSEARGSGQAGRETANGGADAAGGIDKDFPDQNRGADFGKKASSGTEKDMGGVGNY